MLSSWHNFRFNATFIPSDIKEKISNAQRGEGGTFRPGNRVKETCLLTAVEACILPSQARISWRSLTKLLKSRQSAHSILMTWIIKSIETPQVKRPRDWSEVRQSEVWRWRGEGCFEYDEGGGWRCCLPVFQVEKQTKMYRHIVCPVRH